MQTDTQRHDHYPPTVGTTYDQILKNDHAKIKELLAALPKASGRADRVTTLEALKAILIVHNATEENLVYPALAIVADKKAEAQNLYHETAAADLLIFELDSLLKSGGKDADFTKKAEKLQAAILEHIDDEEQKAFPHLEKHAHSQEADQLNASVREFREKLHIDR